MTRRICITGPESTGKSSLAQSLAKEFHCPWVPEYARTYLQKLGRPYAVEDLDEILRGQLWLEAKASSRTEKFLFCDTGPEVIWVWSQFKYGRVSPLIEKITQSHGYDLTLLLDIDLPWRTDPQRENPADSERREILQIYQSLLNRIGRKHAVVHGTGAMRTLNAMRTLCQTRQPGFKNSKE